MTNWKIEWYEFLKIIIIKHRGEHAGGGWTGHVTS